MRAAFSWQTRANALTAIRLFAAPALALAVRSGETVLAAALLTLAIATDFADGWVASRYGEESPLGGLIDHAVDAVFVTTGCAALASMGVLPVPLPVLIALAFLQYAFDSGVSASRPLRASWLGRWNGIAYYVIVAIPVVRDALGLGWPPAWLVLGLGWALVASTGVSMVDRLLASGARGAR
ncbi:MAG: CDP-alcohol phosphatidyltransferase family protein [Myxococcota bacterium]